MFVWKVTYRTNEPQIRYQPLANQTVTHVSALGIRHIFSRALTGVTLKLWLAKNYVTSSTNQSRYFLALVFLLMTPSLLWVLLLRWAPWTSGIQFAVAGLIQCFVISVVYTVSLSPENYLPFQRVGNLSKKLYKFICRTYSRNTPPPPPPAPSKHWYLHYEPYILKLVYERILFCWSLRVRWHNVSTGILRLWLSRSACFQK